MSAQLGVSSVREAAKFPKDGMHGLPDVGSFKRPCTGVCESLLVCIEHLFLVVTIGKLEELGNGVVEQAVKDGLESALRGVDLF